jgi:hypothetical protein
VPVLGPAGGLVGQAQAGCTSLVLLVVTGVTLAVIWMRRTAQSG